jgi:hypothetical protein
VSRVDDIPVDPSNDAQARTTGGRGMTPPLVRVTWHDAWFDFDHEPEDTKELYPVSTVGYVIRETKHVISVAQELLPDDEFRAVTHIPAAVIVDVQPLTGGER